MHSFRFWQNWLLGVSLLLVLVGLLIAFIGGPIFDPHIYPVFWGSQEPGSAALAFQSWIYGVLGATLAGWGIFLSFVVYHAFGNRQRWVWNAITASVSIWYVLDTALSALYQVWVNVAINTVLLVLILLPMALTREAFSRI